MSRVSVNLKSGSLASSIHRDLGNKMQRGKEGKGRKIENYNFQAFEILYLLKINHFIEQIFSEYQSGF